MSNQNSPINLEMLQKVLDAYNQMDNKNNPQNTHPNPFNPNENQHQYPPHTNNGFPFPSNNGYNHHMPPPPPTTNNRVALGGFTQKDIISFVLSLVIALGGAAGGAVKTLSTIESHKQTIERLEKKINEYETSGVPRLSATGQNLILQDFKNELSKEVNSVRSEISEVRSTVQQDLIRLRSDIDGINSTNGRIQTDITRLQDENRDTYRKVTSLEAKIK